jgi:hypothetical protein
MPDQKPSPLCERHGTGAWCCLSQASPGHYPLQKRRQKPSGAVSLVSGDSTALVADGRLTLRLWLAGRQLRTVAHRDRARRQNRDALRPIEIGCLMAPPNRRSCSCSCTCCGGASTEGLSDNPARTRRDISDPWLNSESPRSPASATPIGPKAHTKPPPVMHPRRRSASLCCSRTALAAGRLEGVTLRVSFAHLSPSTVATNVLTPIVQESLSHGTHKANLVCCCACISPYQTGIGTASTRSSWFASRQSAP